jgi:hypothetical protein
MGETISVGVYVLLSRPSVWCTHSHTHTSPCALHCTAWRLRIASQARFHGGGLSFSLEGYWAYARHQRDDLPLYIFDR